MKSAFILLALITPLLAQSKQVQNFWFAGAEISSFELSQDRYGKNHPGHAELIFVTEPFLTDKQVKNESNKPNSTPVLKLNHLTTFNTGIYSYRTMTSTFRPIDVQKFPHALKSTTSVQDWCGQAFQQTNFKNNTWNTQLRSYFENEADQNLTLKPTHLEEELWLTLRLDPKKLPTGETEIIPSALYQRYNHATIEPLKASATLTESNKSSKYTLNYPSINRTLTIHFDTQFPHIIRKYTETNPSGTTTATLKKRLMNSNYWSQHNPEDAPKRKKLGLDPVAN